MKFTSRKWFILVVILAIILRLPYLGGSFWLDEAAQALESSRSLWQQFDIIPDFQPPLLHLITHVALQFSTSEWWLRFWGALLPGIGTIIITYRIGKKWFSPKVGIIASLLLATSSFHIFYSQELRPYSLPTFFAMLSSWEILKILSQKNIPFSSYSVLVFTTVLGLYSSYLYPFFLFAQFIVYLAFKKGSIKKRFLNVFGWGSISALFFAPWLPLFFKQLEAGQLLRTQMPGWENVVSLSQLKSLPLTLGKFVFGVIDLEIQWPFIVMSILIFTMFTVFSILKLKHSTPAFRKNYFILLGLLSITLMGAWIVSFFVPVVRPKRMLLLLPFFYLLLSSVVENKKNISPFFYSYIFLFLSINIYSTYQLFTQPTYQREDWRSLHQEIQTRFPEKQTLIVNSFTAPFSPWAWYDSQQDYSTLSTGSYFIGDVPNLVNTLKPITEYDYVLVFDYLRDLTDPDDRLLQEIENYGYEGIGVIDRVNIGFVRIYAKPTAILSYQFDIRN